MKRFCKRLRRSMTAAAAAVCAIGMTAGVAMADMNGIDVSGWQSSTITQSVPADFAIVKVTEGTWYTNPNWTAQANGATATGKAIGLYHYADGGNAINEADTFVNATAAYHGKAMLVLDWESYGNVSWGNVVWVRQFVNRVHASTSVWPVVYVQRSAVWQVPSDVRQHCMLWVAQYASNASTGYQDSPWNSGASGEGMIQYTSHGVLPGYYGWLDLNRFFGDRTAWQKIACGERKGCVPTPTGTAGKPASTPPSTTGVNLDALASAVIRGEYGNNPQRRQLLGSNYDRVMAIVNRRLGVSTTPAATTPSSTRSYVVRAGDTVSAIAQHTGCLPASAWSVPSGNINLIYVGQTITYHGSTGTAVASTASGHTVRSGESLWSIYGSGWSSAAARNGLHYPYTIFPGQVLR